MSRAVSVGLLDGPGRVCAKESWYIYWCFAEGLVAAQEEHIFVKTEVAYTDPETSHSNINLYPAHGDATTTEQTDKLSLLNLILKLIFQK